MVAIREYAHTRFGYSFDDFDDVYGEFVLWLLRSTNFQLSDFNNPANTNVVASKSINISIPEEKGKLLINKGDAEKGELNTDGIEGIIDLTDEEIDEYLRELEKRNQGNP